MFIRLRQLLRRGRGQEGAVAVEFAIILPVLMLILFGILDWGHFWYMRHVASDASREGARYGTRYATTMPNEAAIKDFVLVKSKYADLLPSDSAPDVKVTGALGSTGTNLVVRVIATKNWWVLGSLVPGLGSSIPVDVTTTMTIE